VNIVDKTKLLENAQIVGRQKAEKKNPSMLCKIQRADQVLVFSQFNVQGDMMVVALLILVSLLFSTFVCIGHFYVEYKGIKNITSRFKLEDVLIITFLSFVPVVNLFMAISLLFRVWAVFGLNDVITDFIRKQK
jgi:hypothetical protein